MHRSNVPRRQLPAGNPRTRQTLRSHSAVEMAGTEPKVIAAIGMVDPGTQMPIDPLGFEDGADDEYEEGDEA